MLNEDHIVEWWEEDNNRTFSLDIIDESFLKELSKHKESDNFDSTKQVLREVNS